MAEEIKVFVGTTDAGQWLAISRQEPFFCMEAGDMDAVVAKALRAWEFWLRHKGVDAEPRVVSSLSLPVRREFTPLGMVTLGAGEVYA